MSVSVDVIAAVGEPTSRSVHPADSTAPLTRGANMRSSERKTTSTGMSVSKCFQRVIDPAGERWKWTCCQWPSWSCQIRVSSIALVDVIPSESVICCRRI